MYKNIRYLLLTGFFLLTPAKLHASSISVTILYTADTHGHIVSDDKTVGLDLVARVKQAHPSAVLLDAGDFMQGAPLANFDKGKTIASFMRRAGYLAATAGNHEFSFGREALLKREREAASGANPMRLLSSNILAPDKAPLLTPWVRADVDTVALCVFGLTTPETKTQALPSAVADLYFTDPIETAATTAKDLRASGCDIVVALSHMGSDHQTPIPSSLIAEQAPELDAVIDGHSHRRFSMRLPDGGPFVVSPGAHGEALGKLEFFVDVDAKKIIHARNAFLIREDVADLAPDPLLAVDIDAYQKKVDAALSQIVAVSHAAMAGDRERMRTQGTTLGNMTADAFREAYGTDAAIVNAGGIRAGLPKGGVARKALLALFPFNNYVVSLEATGKEMLDALEHAYGKLPGADGGFAQISGMTVLLDASASPGRRVKSVSVAGKPLDVDKTYIIAVSDFLAQGGDGYPHFANKNPLQTWMSVEEAVARHLQKNKQVSMPEESRIMFIAE